VTFEAFAGQTLAGVSLGMVWFLIAAGLSIIFGTLKILNLAHGSLYMLGSFCCYQVTVSLAHVAGNFWIGVLVAPIVVALVGGVIEVFLLRPIYKAEMIYQYILTFALVLIIGEACKMIWGVGYHSVQVPWPFQGSIGVFGLSFPSYNFFLIAMGPLVFIGLRTLINKTDLGRNIRAVTENREMANALGTNVPRVYTGVFMLGAWLAGLAGSLWPPVSVVALGSDMAVVIDCFIIVVIGGLGSLAGAFVGAIILGLTTAFGLYLIPKLAVAFGFILMIIILLIRPYGLMGEPE